MATGASAPGFGNITTYADTITASGITAGPDGALWFTNGESIGRIATTGQVTNYPGTGIDGPNVITAGPDGALWFLNGSTGCGGAIGRVTTAGQFSYYAGMSRPTGITAGPDGALRFTNSTVTGGGSIGRITTAGQFTGYTSPSINSPQGITAGPDGALWFTNYTGNSIGRITTTGQVTNYTAGSIRQPEGIAAGPDGALWSTDYGANSISRVSVTFTPTISNSPTFAGYQTTVTAGSATSSAARFTVPTLSCTTATRAITSDAGVAVNNYKTSPFAFVITGCVNGKATYFPGLVVNGKATDYTTTHLSAGDVINLSARVTTSGTTVQVTDVTKGVTKKLTGAGASASAAWIGDDAAVSGSTGKLLGVPKFGTLTFTNCAIDGGTLAVSLPHEYQRVNSSNTVTIATGSLSSTGTAFATNCKHF